MDSDELGCELTTVLQAETAERFSHCHSVWPFNGTQEFIGTALFQTYPNNAAQTTDWLTALNNNCLLRAALFSYTHPTLSHGY